MFVIWPTLVVLSRSFNRSSLFNVLSDSQLRQMLWFTTWQAFISTIATLVIGIPAALVLSRYSFRARQIIRALTFVPFVLPTVVVGIALASLAPASYQSGPTPLILAHIYLNIAVVVRVVGSRWENFPLRLTTTLLYLSNPIYQFPNNYFTAAAQQHHWRRKHCLYLLFQHLRSCTGACGSTLPHY